MVRLSSCQSSMLVNLWQTTIHPKCKCILHQWKSLTCFAKSSYFGWKFCPFSACCLQAWIWMSERRVCQKLKTFLPSPCSLLPFAPLWKTSVAPSTFRARTTSAPHLYPACPNHKGRPCVMDVLVSPHRLSTLRVGLWSNWLPHSIEHAAWFRARMQEMFMEWTTSQR